MSKQSVSTVEMVDLQLPNFFKVVIHNNDTTPIDLVILAIGTAIEVDDSTAYQLAQEAHWEGFAVIGIFTETRANEIVHICNSITAQNGHPEFKATKEKDH